MASSVTCAMNTFNISANTSTKFKLYLPFLNYILDPSGSEKVMSALTAHLCCSPQWRRQSRSK